MALLISGGVTKIYFSGTTQEVSGTLYGFLQFGSNYLGREEAALRLYLTKEDCKEDKSIVNTTLPTASLKFDVPSTEAPSLSLAETTWKSKLEALGYTVTIKL